MREFFPKNPWPSAPDPRYMDREGKVLPIDQGGRSIENAYQNLRYSTPRVAPEAYGATDAQLAQMNAILGQKEAERQAIRAREAPQAASPQILAALEAAAQGRGPSSAAAQYQLNQDQLVQAQLAQMGGGRQAYAAGLQNMGQQLGQSAYQSAVTAAQERAAARGQYFGQAASQADLEARQRDLNLQGSFGYMDAISKQKAAQRANLIRRQEVQGALEANYRSALAQAAGAQSAATTQKSTAAGVSLATFLAGLV